MMKKNFFLVGILLLLFVFLIRPAEAINLLVEQGKVRLRIAPGQTKTGTITIRNTETQPSDIRVYLEDWYYLPVADGTKEFKPKGTTPLSCASWINFSPAEFTIPAYGKKEVNYTVKVPDNASGGHYAVMFFETMLAEPGTMEGFGLGVAARLGTLFYIEPEGSIRSSLEIGAFSVSREAKGPLVINLDLKNTGNVDITASGTFHIIDKQGMVYARSEFNTVYTFPTDTGTLRGEWKEPIPAGIYDLVITVDAGKALEESGMGRGPVITKEAEIEVGAYGEVVKAGELK